MREAEFRDPRLVEVYDAECVWGPDDDWFVAVVDASPSSRIVDLGCGTGRLTLALAARGHTVTGVDPARPSLDAARRKPGADRVTWIEGASADLPDGGFDVALMTSHVAQFLVTDEGWAATLADLARAVVPGGRLTFDSRDPADRAWERWGARQATLTDGRVVRIDTEVTAIDGPVVAFTHTYAFPDGTLLTSEAALRFRPRDELTETLAGASFGVERIDLVDGDQFVVAKRG